MGSPLRDLNVIFEFRHYVSIRGATMRTEEVFILEECVRL